MHPQILKPTIFNKKIASIKAIKGRKILFSSFICKAKVMAGYKKKRLEATQGDLNFIAKATHMQQQKNAKIRK